MDIQIYDALSGSVAMAQKKELQRAIKDELMLGGEGLAEEDLFLLEFNMGNLKSTSGDDQAYWLLAICAAQA